MRLLVVTVAVILCFTFDGSAALGQAPWKEFRSKECKFKVVMPSVPEETSTNVPLPDGTTLMVKMFSADGDSTVHLVTFQENPAEAETEKVYETARERIIKKLNGKILQNKSVKLAGKYPGIEFLLDVPDRKLAYRARMYLVGRRFYQVTVGGPMEGVTSPESDRYLDSFALIK
jgi:hypothetical protein